MAHMVKGYCVNGLRNLGAFFPPFWGSSSDHIGWHRPCNFTHLQSGPSTLTCGIGRTPSECKRERVLGRKAAVPEVMEQIGLKVHGTYKWVMIGSVPGPSLYS